MPPRSLRPQGGGEGPDSENSWRSARRVFLGRLQGDAFDHRPVQAQIGQFPTGQRRQFIHRLAIDAMLGKPAPRGFDQRQNAKAVVAFQGAMFARHSHGHHPYPFGLRRVVALA